MPTPSAAVDFDPLVANPGRLQILTALAAEQRQDFAQLRRRTRLTDGNLACHARRLRSAGLIEVDKSVRDGKPVTRFGLTPAGRAALEGHVQRLLAALRPAPNTAAASAPLEDLLDEPIEEPWID
jgi:DNA-binding MarR family transcriptional regulator